jgi:hypothetical protein
MAVTAVASSTTSATLKAANAQRKAIVIENSDANRLYVRLDSGTASSSAYSFSLAQNENATLRGYTGEITGVWAADGSGSAHVTEY